MIEEQSGEQSNQAPQPSADYDDDLDRRRPQRGAPVLGSATLADLHTGMARAFAEGFRAYEQEVDAASHDDVVDLASRMFDGLIRSSAAFAEEVSRSARRMADRRRDDRDRERERERASDSRRGRETNGSPPPIDYDRLARLVAKELRQQTSPAATEPPAPLGGRAG